MTQFAPEPGSREAFDAFVGSLLLANWDSATGPLRLSSDLVLADLESAILFQNARLFLAALNEVGGMAVTATGNLNRVFVRQMFDRLILSERLRETTLQFCKVLNEPDVWPLHVVRIVSECAGLVARRGKVFRVTRTGCGLLDDAKAGSLFRQLFITHFRKFDLQYNFQFRAVPGIQETMAVILWRLDYVARDWTPVGGLAEQLLLPGVLNQLHTAMVSPYDTEAWAMAGYVLDPLVELGLLQRNTPSDTPFTDRDEVRTTALWPKFIQFDDWKEA